MAPYWSVELARTCPLRELLTHLYVLLPVLDDDKHYYIGDEEVDKLLRFGDGWLADHPERETIATRYLKHRTAASPARPRPPRRGRVRVRRPRRRGPALARDLAEESLERP
jgi:hypothetical protein